MVQIFSKSGFYYERYGHGFAVPVSRAFIEKHGKEKTEEILRQVMLRFREVDETVPAFESQKQHTVDIDNRVKDGLKALAEQRGLSMASLIRESLHCHLLTKVEPVRLSSTKFASFQLHCSPFEMKLLNQWKERNYSSTSDYISTLACATPPCLMRIWLFFPLGRLSPSILTLSF